MKRLACILIAVVLAGCSSKKTVGTVDMDRLISLDSLWENLDEFTGKMVTLKFDTIYTTSTGTNKLPSGEVWYTTGISTNTRGLWDEELTRQALMHAIDSTCPKEQAQCFGDISNYHVDIANGSEQFPKDIPNEEILRNFDGTGEFNGFEKSGHRVLTCYVLGGYPKRINGHDRYGLLNREIIVAPVGYQYDSDEVFLPVSWK